MLNPTRQSRIAIAASVVLVAIIATAGWADELTAISGEKTQGAITRITPEGLIQGDSIPDGLKLSSLELVTTENQRQPNENPNTVIRLSSGGELFATNVTVENETVRATCFLGELTLPVESVRAIVFQPENVDSRTTKAIASPSSKEDTVIAKTEGGSQAASGMLGSIVDGKVSIQHEGKMRSISMSKVIAVVIADLGIELPAGTSARCKLVDGSSVTGRLENLENGRLTMRLPGTGKLEFDWEKVAEIGVISDRLVYLSDLEPVDSEHEPIVTVAMPWKRDTSVLGNPISMKSKTQRKPVVYARGIGMHSYSRLVFTRPPGFNRFMAIVGIDDETDGKGNCIFIVRNDGIQVWSKAVKAGDEPVQLDIDISNTKEVSIIVESGEQLDMGDHANWANARFLKTE